MSKFSEFNKAVNKDQLQKDIATVLENNYKKVPSGKYLVDFEKMEIGECGENAKTPHAPLFKLTAKIIAKINDDEEEVETEFKDLRVFMNKVIYVANESERWNTGKAIGVVIGFLNSIDCGTKVVFDGDYDHFADLVLDIAEECQQLQFVINYDEKAFNCIDIEEVYEK